MPILRTAATLAVVASGTLIAQRGDTVVRMASQPVHAGVATLQKEVSIGIANGDEHYVLGGIFDIAVGTTGAMYVWDRSVPAIRMYDASGKYVKTIGAKGSGPGEYLAGAALAITKSGNLLLWDPGNARINVYTSQGAVVTTWPTKSGNSGVAVGRGLLMTDTAGMTYIHTFMFDRRPGKPLTSRSAWIRFRPDGSLKDTLFAPPGPDDKSMVVENGRGQMAERGVPFAPSLQAAMSPLGHFVTGWNDRIAIDLHEPGKPIASIRRTVALEPVSAHERDSARADVTGDMKAVLPSWSWSGSEIPKTKPAYHDLLIAQDGRIWVELDRGPRAKEDSAAANRGDVLITEGKGPRGGRGGPVVTWSCPASGQSLFDVYEPSGRYLGQVQLPARMDPIVMRGDFIWATTCSADDVPNVVRYRIVWR